jgi:predicted CXXCH cytochrome family protein
VPCASCHGPADEFQTPSKDCHACHRERRSAEDDASATQLAVAREISDADCLGCHTEIKERFEHAVCVHGPAADGSGCLTCHPQPHTKTEPTARAQRRELCLGCHDKSIKTKDGRVLENIAGVLSQNPNHHGPVRDGNCGACHQPHASDYGQLLCGQYTSGFYASFDLKQYELCFGCHDRDAVLRERGAVLTGFRAGDRNLHWLHVNREKGRTCRACHEVHASSRPFHIRESVPYGDSGWKLPINYTQTPRGGTCAPGCHSAKSYERSEALQAAVPGAADRAR